MSNIQMPVFIPVATIRAGELARWLNEGRERWWLVDGEPHLMENVDFPCPGDELAEALRGLPDRALEILRDVPQANPTPELTGQSLKDYANRENRHKGMNFLLRWQGDTQPWLLSEDVLASESSSSNNE